MKLHLPLSLRSALLFGAAFFSNQNLYAEVTLTDNPTIWTEESAPGYTGEENAYVADSIQWNILSGNFSATKNSIKDVHTLYIDSSTVSNKVGSLTVSATASQSKAYGIDASSSSLTNGGNITSSVETLASGYAFILTDLSSLSNTGHISTSAKGIAGASNNLNGMCAFQVASSEISNKKGGILTAYAYAPGDCAYGLYATDSSLTNAGTVTATAISQNASVALKVAGENSSLINEAGGELTAHAIASIETSHAIGVYNGAAVINRGQISATAEGGHVIYSIYLSQSASLVNEVDGKIITTAKSTTGDGRGISLEHSSSLTNAGNISVFAEGSARGIFVESGSTLTNTAGATLAITTVSQNSECGIEAYGATLLNDGTLVSKGKRGEIRLLNSSLTNTGTIEAASFYTQSFYIDSSSKLINKASGTIAIDATGEFFLNNFSSFFNEGQLQTNSVYTVGDESGSVFYALNGSTVSACTESKTLSFSGTGSVSLGGELAEDGSVTALAAGSSLTANSGLSFSGVTVDIVDELTLHMGGDLTFAEDVTLNRNGHSLIIDNGATRHKVTLGDDFCAEWDGSVRVNDDDALLELMSEGGNALANGTLTAESISLDAVQDTTFTVKDTALNLQGGSLSLTNVIVKGSSSFTSTASTYTASLNNTTFVLNADTSSHLAEAPTLPDSMSNLVATTVTSAYYVSYDMLAGCSVSGSLTLDFSYWASEISSRVYDGIVLTLGEGMVFTMNADSVFGSLDGESKGIAEAVSGNSVLFLVSNLPSNNRVVESDGIVTGPLSDKHVVELAPGGRVDVSALPDLPQDYISGTGGELVTSPSQRLELRGQEDIGYDIIGHQPGGFGADLQIGKPHGTLGDADITLNGHRYDSKLIDVLSGKLTINGHAVLGMAGSVTTIGSGSAPGSGTHRAEVLNHGTMRGDVLVEQDGMLRNNGHLEGALTIHRGGRLHGSGHFHGHTHIHGGAYHYVGNSPGYQEFTNGLTYGNGANLTFCVDGATAASAANAGSGTHSFLKVSGGTLTLEGNVNTTVEVTSGIRTMGAMPFSLTLMQVDLSNAVITNTGGNSQPFSLTLSDTENLVPNASVTLTWDAVAGTLALSGTWDKYATAALLAGDGSTIANTLWSSTSAVQAFARTAGSQLSSPVVSKNGVSVWGSALGDYVSMSGFRSSAQGYAVGADKQWCPHIRGGIAFGQMFGDFTADRGVAEVEQEGVMVGLYSEYLRKLNKCSSLSLTGYAAYGQVENDANTLVGGSSLLPGRASWDDKVLALGARAQWNIHLTEKTTLAPFIGLEYLRGEQDDFTETFTGGFREYRDGSMQVWSMPIGVTARTEVSLGRTQKLLPELTVAYVGDIARKEPHVRSRVYGVDNCHEGTKPGRSGFMLNVGTHWLISENWSAGAFYNVETRSHEVSQEFNAAVRYSF